MDLRFYLDPATGHPHIWNHDVDEEEVEEVLTNPEEDRPGRDGSRVAHGRTASGRYLKVIYIRDPMPDSVFVITGYELRGNHCWPTAGGKGESTDEAKPVPGWLG